MRVKIMHHCVFLIITFSWHGLCIQNGRSAAATFAGAPRNRNMILEPRQSSFHPSEPDSSGFTPMTRGGFSFPDNYKHHHKYQTNNPNELPSTFRGNTNPYPNNQPANNNQRANPHNLALNTGEYSADAYNNHNNYPYQQHTNAIASFGHRLSPAFPNANDNYLTQQAALFPYQQPSNYKIPNYPPSRFETFPKQKPIYAQAYDNYLYNRQPNYNRRPTPPPPPSVPISYYPHPQASPYGDASYQDGHLTRPYRNDLTSTPNTYPSQYANQFGNFILPFVSGTGMSTNPLGSLLNTIGVPFAGGGNPLSMQIIDGLEKIARNDDLQCVPKVLCQMLGSPTQRAQLPSFITSPVLTSFITSLPSSSPALTFGRAALLGLSGGEHSCAHTYSKCPKNEDDILYYLNNHRGGFFKFFSEPGSKPVSDTHDQHTTSSTTSSNQQSQPSIFNFLSGLGSLSPVTTTTNTASNQGNVNSFMSESVMNGIGSLFGNIISGFLSGQPATRRILTDARDEDEKAINEDMEARILNNNSNLLSHIEPTEPTDNPISFPQTASGSGSDGESKLRFPTAPHEDDDHQRGSKKLNFKESYPRPTRGGTKMIFPDRTGTGNLRFDNDEFFRVGRIINQPHYGSEVTWMRTTPRPTKRTYSTSFLTDGSLDRYLSSNYKTDSSQSNRIKDDTSGNVYVTNSHGVTEYYINAKGQKVYL